MAPTSTIRSRRAARWPPRRSRSTWTRAGDLVRPPEQCESAALPALRDVVTRSGPSAPRLAALLWTDGRSRSAAPCPADAPAPDFTSISSDTLGGPISVIAHSSSGYDHRSTTRPSRPTLTGSSFAARLDGHGVRGAMQRLCSIAPPTMRACCRQIRFNLSDRHPCVAEVNYTWSEQQNVPSTWTAGPQCQRAGAGSLQRLNGSLVSYLKPNLAEQFRFQYSREIGPARMTGPERATGRQSRRCGRTAVPGCRRSPRFPFRHAVFRRSITTTTRVQLWKYLPGARRPFLQGGFEYNKVHSIQTLSDSRTPVHLRDVPSSWLLRLRQQQWRAAVLQQAGVGRRFATQNANIRRVNMPCIFRILGAEPQLDVQYGLR